MFAYLIALITAREVGQQISQMVREITLSILEASVPIVNVLSVAMIALGLLIAVGFRQEFLGWRLVAGGLIALVFANLVLPLIISFI